MFLLIICGITAIALYKRNYNRRINRQLAEGNFPDKKRMSPAGVTVIVIFSVAVLMIITAVAYPLIAFTFYSTGGEHNNNNHYCSATFTDENCADSEYYYFAEAYKKGKMNGYTVETKQQGNFEYTLFRDKANTYFPMKPAFALFVKYTGSKNYKGYAECTEFSSPNGGGASSSTGRTAGYYCFLGNADNSDGCVTLAMFDDFKTCKKIFDKKLGYDSTKDTMIKYADEIFELEISDINVE